MLSIYELEELYEQYADSVAYILSFYTSHTAQLEDWTQDVFVKVWEARDHIDPEHPGLKGYILTIAHNHARYEANKTSQSHHLDNQELAEPLPSRHPSTSQRVQANDLTQAYQQALAKVSPRARQTFKLSRDNGFSYREIARSMGISSKTVEAQVSKTLRILRGELEEYRL
ncbi:RNA polymerase sigma factor [Fodinibius salsisoli]|uniref:Sigma-70 family RNA polymerase sigma factor n=1 Tax=Fodinibius salsisoli TaxID=2820877 RepID=A0ABT3PSF5_9BACT|nr:sigma-70 family RNA polymerase sigma factor [Fodinibius salsisoli]MCW9708799.1 sigma-70 family RNA polymerase sigma factor [Fodinibius salsisoli]